MNEIPCYLDAAPDGLLGEHRVDGEVLADVPQELHERDRAQPLRVVDELGGVLPAIEVEEAGQLFGVPGSIGNVRHATWAEFRRRELAPNLRELDFIGRAITPSFQPIRFHARFFAVDADHFGPEISQHHRCKRSWPDPGDLDDLDALQWPHAALPELSYEPP